MKANDENARAAPQRQYFGPNYYGEQDENGIDFVAHS